MIRTKKLPYFAAGLDPLCLDSAMKAANAAENALSTNPAELQSAPPPFFPFFFIIKVCPLMEVATSLIWFCWAGTMGSKEGGVLG